jgi:hypothetical protein
MTDSSKTKKKYISHIYTKPTKSVTLHIYSSLLLDPRNGKEKKLGKYQNKYIKMY